MFYRFRNVGRVRFINVGIDEEKVIAQKSAEALLNSNKHLILSPYSPITVKVKRIVENLAKHTENLIPGARTSFQVYVLDSPEPNAFVLPGGQIFVFTGILPVAKNDTGLATVLAHEVQLLVKSDAYYSLKF